jgi:hypothetical protein
MNILKYFRRKKDYQRNYTVDIIQNALEDIDTFNINLYIEASDFMADIKRMEQEDPMRYSFWIFKVEDNNLWQFKNGLSYAINWIARNESKLKEDKDSFRLYNIPPTIFGKYCMYINRLDIKGTYYYVVKFVSFHRD